MYFSKFRAKSARQSAQIPRRVYRVRGLIKSVFCKCIFDWFFATKQWHCRAQVSS